MLNSGMSAAGHKSRPLRCLVFLAPLYLITKKNRREPDTETLLKFADLFQVSVDYLVGRTKLPQQILDDNIRDFVDQLELSDDEILEKFSLTIDGLKLTPEEARRFIAFVRAERMMK